MSISSSKASCSSAEDRAGRRDQEHLEHHHVAYVRQGEPLGLGHAGLVAAELVATSRLPSSSLTM